MGAAPPVDPLSRAEPRRLEMSAAQVPADDRVRRHIRAGDRAPPFSPTMVSEREAIGASELHHHGRDIPAQRGGQAAVRGRQAGIHVDHERPLGSEQEVHTHVAPQARDRTGHIGAKEPDSRIGRRLGVDHQPIEMEPARPPGEALPIAAQQARPSPGTKEREAPGLAIDPGLGHEPPARRAKAGLRVDEAVEPLEAIAAGPIVGFHHPGAGQRRHGIPRSIGRHDRNASSCERSARWPACWPRGGRPWGCIPAESGRRQ